MEKIMNIMHHGKHGQRHRPRDASELYELEHMPRKFVNSSSDNAKSHDFAKPRDLETSRSNYRETEKALQHYWAPPKDGNTNFEVEKSIGLEHGHQRRHRPRDAFELYELEHMPRTFMKISSGRVKPCYFAKSCELEAFKPDYYETGRTQHYEHPTKDGDTGTYNEDIDAEAEEFIESKHKKFELAKWMSMNGY